jgi:zinc transporter ZupT
LIRAPLSTTTVLDESAESVRTAAAPWAGVLILTALPYRFAQMYFVDRLLQFGSDASHYGRYLLTVAGWTMVAFVVARWGRLVFARAIRLATESGRPVGREAMRLPAATLVDYLYVSLILECISVAAFVTCLAPAVCTIVSGLAIGTAELNDQPSAIGPFRRIAQHGRNVKIGTALAFVFAFASVVALVNVTATFGIGLWLGSAVGGWDVQRWTRLLSPANRRFFLVIIAGALMVIEPFWVAAYVTLVRKGEAAESGDDLRAWLEELRSA